MESKVFKEESEAIRRRLMVKACQGQWIEGFKEVEVMLR